MDNRVYGFVGLGQMGGPMTARLLAGGHSVVVYDSSAAALDRAVQRGAQAAASVKDVCDRADVVFLSLPTPDIVLAVTLGPGGVVEGSRVKRVFDFSTIGPRAATAAAAGLAPKGIVYADAPVSGGVKGATNGTLAVMVSCPKAVYEENEPVLATFGKLFHLGEKAGQAQTMKLANNLLSMTAIAITSEVMVMGVKAGLDAKTMLEVINSGTGRNTASTDKFPRAVLPGTFDFGFATGLAYKDVCLCVNEAEALGVPMIAGGAVRELYAVTQAMLGADSDFTAVCKVIESWAGVEVRG
jgi:3-hydroxyisobutyrate dehydrogenase-like beta-hydroxyacid dehydrogenase